MSEANLRQKRKRSDDPTYSNKKPRYWTDELEHRSQFITDRISYLMHLNQMMECETFAEEALKITRVHTRKRGICRVSPFQSSVNLPNAPIKLENNSEQEVNHDYDAIQMKKVVADEILRLEKCRYDQSQPISSPMFDDLVAFMRNKIAIRSKSVIAPTRRLEPQSVLVNTGATRYRVVGRPLRSHVSEADNEFIVVSLLEDADGRYYHDLSPSEASFKYMAFQHGQRLADYV